MKKSVLSDMDGVIYRGGELIPGAQDFINRLLAGNYPFLFLTNNSEQTPLDLLRKLEGLGVKGLTEAHFLTSAMATAIFLSQQGDGRTAYVIGGAGLSTELYNVGFSITEKNPDYVVVGKTKNYNYEMISKACELIHKGARFIATNPDVVDPVASGVLEPACGSLIAPIVTATGKKPYIVGKPNAMMMLIARKKLGSHSENTVMIGDRMDTDIIGGMEAGMITCLVLSGVSKRSTVGEFPYRPTHVFNNVGEISLEEL